MIKLVNVSKYYNSNDVVALGLRKVNLELRLNEFVAVVGESGSGKTTLLNVISGIDTYEDGEMYINGEETSYYSINDLENYRKKYVAFVFQDYNLIDSYTVLQNVEAPLLLSGYPKDKIKKRALEIIDRVGLSTHVHHKASKLSGGQKQRVVIARALAKDCPIIAADEPTGNLDSESAKQIIKLLAEIAKDKLVIMVTHDFSQVESFATRKIRIYDGEIVEDQTMVKVDEGEFPELDDKEYKASFLSLLKISFQNLLSVPKKTILMVIVFWFFAFFVGLSYAGYINVTNTSVELTNFYFSYTNPDRLVVKKADDSPLSDDDLAELLGYNHVKAIIENDYILDATKEISFNTGNFPLFSYSFLPLSLLNMDEEPLHGSWPDEDYDIIIAANNDLLNIGEDVIDEELIDFYRLGNINYKYKVSGIIDNDVIPGSLAVNNNYIYVSDVVWEKLKTELYLNYYGPYNYYTVSEPYVKIELLLPNSSYIFNNEIFTINNSLDDFILETSDSFFFGECSGICQIQGDLNISDYYYEESLDVFLTLNESITDESIHLNQNTFDLIFYEDVYQVSIMVTDINRSEDLQDQISRITESGNSKYKVVYPYDSSPLYDFEETFKILATIGMLILTAVTIIASSFLSYIIFKAIINTKLRDYSIFRTIGANQRVIRSFIYIENFMVFIIAYIIFLIISLTLPNKIPGFTLFDSLGVYSFLDYVMYFILLSLMSIFISQRYCNKIFQYSVSKTLKTELE